MRNTLRLNKVLFLLLSLCVGYIYANNLNINYCVYRQIPLQSAENYLFQYDLPFYIDASHLQNDINITVESEAKAQFLCKSAGYIVLDAKSPSRLHSLDISVSNHLGGFIRMGWNTDIGVNYFSTQERTSNTLVCKDANNICHDTDGDYGFDMDGISSYYVIYKAD